MKEPLILVCLVEDRYEIRNSLKILINDAPNCSCVGDFETAEEAIEKIPELQPDVVLMDIDLPGMNGIKCIEALKPLCPRVQFMVCTVYDEDEKIIDALAAGANSYILKRASAETLIHSITELYNGGSPMSSDIARKVVQHFQRPSTPGNSYNLTVREKEIIQKLAKGHTYQQVADELFISHKTIKKHVYNIYEKLHVNSRMEAINKFFGR